MVDFTSYYRKKAMMKLDFIFKTGMVWHQKIATHGPHINNMPLLSKTVPSASYKPLRMYNPIVH